MTADDAGVNVRERLMNAALPAFEQEYDALTARVPLQHSTKAAIAMGKAIDAILAAGFGDVAEAQELAWDEGYDAGGDDEVFAQRGSPMDSDAHEFPHRNPYGTTSTNGASE